MNLNKTILEFRQIIEKSENPFLFFDSDCDGITAYFQIKKKWEKVKGTSYIRNEKYLEKTLEKISQDCDLIILFDIPIVSKNFLNHKNIKDKKILWVDHHKTDLKKLLSENENIQYLNPLNFHKLDNRPASYFAYKIANLKSNIELCMLGNLADFFLLETLPLFEKYNKELFKKIFNIDEKKKEEIFNFIEKNKFYEGKMQKTKSNYIQFLCYETNFQKLKNFIDFLFKIENKKEIQKAIEIISKLNLDEIFDKIMKKEDTFPFCEYSKLLKKYEKIYNRITYNYFEEIKKIVLDSFSKIKIKIYNEDKKKEDKLFYCEYKNKIGFTKQLVEELAYRFPKKEIFVVVFKGNNDNVKISFRSRGKIKVNNLIKQLLKEVKGSGGGHSYAAACSVFKKDFSKFKKNLFKIYK
jgi:hypothetical protein